MNSLEEVLKQLLWSLPIILERGKWCFLLFIWLVGSIPPLFILVIINQNMGLCFFCSEQVVSHSAKFSPPLKCCNSSYPQRKDPRREAHTNEAIMIQNLLNRCSQVWWSLPEYLWRMNILDFALAQTRKHLQAISSSRLSTVTYPTVL